MTSQLNNLLGFVKSIKSKKDFSVPQIYDISQFEKGKNYCNTLGDSFIMIHAKNIKRGEDNITITGPIIKGEYDYSREESRIKEEQKKDKWVLSNFELGLFRKAIKFYEVPN